MYYLLPAKFLWDLSWRIRAIGAFRTDAIVRDMVDMVERALCSTSSEPTHHPAWRILPAPRGASGIDQIAIHACA